MRPKLARLQAISMSASIILDIIIIIINGCHAAQALIGVRELLDATAYELGTSDRIKFTALTNVDNYIWKSTLNYIYLYKQNNNNMNPDVFLYTDTDTGAIKTLPDFIYSVEDGMYVRIYLNDDYRFLWQPVAIFNIFPKHSKSKQNEN